MTASRRFLLLIPVAALLAPARANAAPSFRLESERDIFPSEHAHFAGKGHIPHAATIAQTAGGTLVAVWKVGREKSHEEDLRLSRFIDDDWTEPRPVWDGDETGDGKVHVVFSHHAGARIVPTQRTIRHLVVTTAGAGAGAPERVP